MTEHQLNIHQDNYFLLLGLPLSFEIDMELLNNNYHTIQKNIHPDNFANTSDLERRLSVQKAAQINDALQTLKKPLRRAIYLLSLFGIELGENDTNIDPAFLMEQMELRENLAQVGNQVDPFEALDAILKDVKSRIAEVIEQISNQFSAILTESSDKEQRLLETKSHVLKLQFLNRLQEECLNKEEELVDQN